MSGTMERFRQEIIVENIMKIVTGFNSSITKAMEVLGIPESEYAMYEELVRRSEAASSK